MTRKRPARKSRGKRAAKGGAGRFVLWGVVAVLTVASAVVGGHLVRSLPAGDSIGSVDPANRTKGVLEQLEDLLGPLDAAGVRVRVDSSRRALELSAEVGWPLYMMPLT